MNHSNDLLDTAERLKNLMVMRATGGPADASEYRDLRQELVSEESIRSRTPAFVRRCRTIDEFWAFIQTEFGTYKERRRFLQDAFSELLDYLEGTDFDSSELPNSVPVFKDVIEVSSPPRTPKVSRRPNLFISYAHSDESSRDMLLAHLHTLIRLGEIELWHDQQILPGDEWENAVRSGLKNADIVVLLISADFVKSHWCYSIEMEAALSKHDSGQARVIPVLVRSCVWAGLPFAKLQMLPTGAKPVTAWDDRDEAWADVVARIRAAVKSMTS